MFGIRNARLLPLALLVTVAFLYIGWHRPLAWNPAATTTGPDISRIPTSGTDKHAHHGSPPPGAADPKQETKDDATYDFKRPTTADEAGYPAVVPPDKKPPVINSGLAVDKPKEQIMPPVAAPLKTNCVAFERYMSGKPGPASAGFREFPNLRPPPECRSFKVPAVDEYIEKMKDTIKDPDLYRLFENSFPNTLDTMVKWHGYAQDQNGNETNEELSYIITGDIDAMWLRDSASQLYSYLSFLAPHDPEGGSGSDIKSLNSLWRGLINSHSRYIIISPYCHSFQPPPESGIPPTLNGAYKQNNPRPAYDPKKVFDCKWELDSLASFLQVSVGYWTHTHDLAFFARHNWIEAVKAAVDAAGAMRLGTYDKEGHVLPSAWTFTGWTNRGSETLTNDGLGNPSRENGMVRTAFRPSDDATIFQFLVPANMMWAKYLEEASALMEELAEGAVHEIDATKQAMARNLVQPMRDFALGIRRGIHRDAIVSHRDYGEIFAYECDGFGGVNLMDDANVPSLLSMPLFGYASSRFALPSEVTESERDYHEIYQNTRRFALSLDNPYYAKGPALSAVGGPHLGPGRAWPMAALVAGLTAFDAESGYVDSRGLAPLTVGKGVMLEDHVAEQLGMVLNSTSGWGIVHESVNSWNGNAFSRAWFGWANGLLGELVVRLEKWEGAQSRSGGKEGLLSRSWQ